MHIEDLFTPEQQAFVPGSFAECRCFRHFYGKFNGINDMYPRMLD